MYEIQQIPQDTVISPLRRPLWYNTTAEAWRVSHQFGFLKWFPIERLLLEHSQDITATAVPLLLIKYHVAIPQPQAFILLMDVGMLIEITENCTHSEN